MSIANKRAFLKNPADIGSPGPFPSLELGHSIQQTAISQVLGGRGMNGMEVGVKADIMLPQRLDHIATTASLKHACLFSNDFEGGTNVTLGEHVRQAFARVVIGQ